MGKKIKFSLLVICLYIFLYNPVFQYLEFGLIKLLLLISLFFLLQNQYIIFWTKFKNELLFVLVITLYIMLISIIFGDGSSLVISYLILLWFLEGFAISAFIVFGFKEIFNEYSWESPIILVGTIASIISILLITNPSLNAIVRYDLLRDSMTYEIDSIYKGFQHRGFALTESSTGTYGLIQGFILSVALISLKKSKKYLVSIPLLFISILFNQRMGFLIVVIFVSIWLFTETNKIKFFGYILVSLVLLTITTKILSDYEDTLTWASALLDQTFDIFRSSSYYSPQISVYETLYYNHIFFPKSLEGFIFGEGNFIYNNRFLRSDIGYVNQLFIGGTIFIAASVTFMSYMLKRQLTYNHGKLIPVFIFIIFLVINFKGLFLLWPSGIARLSIFYYVYIVLMNSSEKYIIKKNK